MILEGEIMIINWMRPALTYFKNHFYESVKAVVVVSTFVIVLLTYLNTLEQANNSKTREAASKTAELMAMWAEDKADFAAALALLRSSRDYLPEGPFKDEYHDLIVKGRVLLEDRSKVLEEMRHLGPRSDPVAVDAWRAQTAIWASDINEILVLLKDYQSRLQACSERQKQGVCGEMTESQVGSKKEGTTRPIE
jgi:hypothetical protein